MGYQHTDSFRSRHITELFIAQYSSGERMVPSNFRGIVMIGTAESQTSLHALVHTLHIFQDIYHLQSPNKDARKEVSRRSLLGASLQTNFLIRY